jgi:hypothetical protein
VHADKPLPAAFSHWESKSQKGKLPFKKNAIKNCHCISIAGKKSLKWPNTYTEYYKIFPNTNDPAAGGRPQNESIKGTLIITILSSQRQNSTDHATAREIAQEQETANGIPLFLIHSKYRQSGSILNPD